MQGVGFYADIYSYPYDKIYGGFKNKLILVLSAFFIKMSSSMKDLFSRKGIIKSQHVPTSGVLTVVLLCLSVVAIIGIIVCFQFKLPTLNKQRAARISVLHVTKDEYNLSLLVDTDYDTDDTEAVIPSSV